MEGMNVLPFSLFPAHCGMSRKTNLIAKAVRSEKRRNEKAKAHRCKN
jgi:hypothetical protein